MFVDSATVPVGSAAPDFTLPDRQGVEHALSSYRGHKVALVFLRGFL